MKKAIFLLLIIFPLLASAQDLRESVCIVSGEYSDAEKSRLENYALWLSRAHFAPESRMLSIYKKGTFGSGSVVEADGKRYVLTNRHVVGYAKQVTLEFMLRNESRKFEHCPILTVSQDYDLALILLPDSCTQPAIKLSSAEMDEGQDIVAVGFPGLDNKPSWQLTKGTISNATLRIDDVEHPFVQHTASIDPGSSGGPLLIKNDDGYALIGVNTLKAAYRESVGLAIPTTEIRTFISGAGIPQLVDQQLLTDTTMDGETWANIVNKLSPECFDSLRTIKREMPLDIVANTRTFECDAREAKKAKRAKMEAEENVAYPMDDDDYDYRSSIRLEYTNYFSANQRLDLAYERTFLKYIITGIQVSAQNDRYMAYDADSAAHQQTATTLALGFRAGIRVPITVAEKYLIIPRVIAAPSFSLFTQTDEPLERVLPVSLPLRIGVDFAMPHDKVSFNVGLHYTYEVSVCSLDLLTKDNSNVPRHLIRDNGMRRYGQSGLNISVALGW